ncbi:hypothetical protein FOMG_16234 [Fusarium oxysporum f. sp. melonis 26406]|uniref:Zn(2)-C6 fungal-type domain-containing protein n=1 Tax=Fusarium oxysporum f. sp. melonis 26406 TaxID=1089452 RepID=W9ZF36_FUSOX|nr:hypothetical protein FOMG_16234 [Fusarium oxysporum f. sp. melonis 26406]
MYRPAPARPKKTNITRTKAGCNPCRRKKRKCDEAKPTCGRCANGHDDCEYSSVFEFRDATQWAARKVKRAKITPLDATPSPSSLVQTFAITPSALQSDDVDDGDDHNDVVITVDGVDRRAASRSRTPVRSIPMLPSPEFGQGDIDDTWLVGTGMSPVSLLESHVWQDLVLLNDTFAAELQNNLPCTAPADELIRESEPGRWDNTQVYPQNAASWTSAPLDSSRGGGKRAAGVTTPRQGSLSYRQSLAMLPGRSPQQQYSPHPLCVPELPIEDRLYLAHLRINLLGSLPYRIEFLWGLVVEAPEVRYAALALAAASLANDHGMHAPDKHGVWIPLRSHASKALDFTSKSLTLEQDNAPLALQTRLALLIIRLCYQFEVGSVKQVRQVLRALGAKVLSIRDHLAPMPCGFDVARTWLHFKALSDMTTQPYAPYGPESLFETSVAELEMSVATEALTVNTIGTQALRLCHRILLARCMSSPGCSATDTINKIADWWSILKGGQVDDAGAFSSVLTESELYIQLMLLKSRLQACGIPSGLPADLDTYAKAGSEIEPLHFATYEQAMACADYLFAKIVTDSRLLDELLGRGSATTDGSQDFVPQHNSCLHVLYRIATGLSDTKHARRSMYRKSMAIYLHHASHLCNSIEGVEFLGSYLERLLQAGTFQEGPFSPCGAFRLFNNTVLKQMQQGRTIFLASMTHGSLADREFLFAKGSNEYVIICGREGNNRYFNDLIPLHHATLDT